VPDEPLPRRHRTPEEHFDCIPIRTYRVSANGSAEGYVTLTSSSLPRIDTAPPPEFDGPEGVWSPETLLCAAIADCFILTFRGLSRAARFEWLTLECHVAGTLERSNCS
jgi:organic hydroperoxide reductase OsmC/OhrA